MKLIRGPGVMPYSFNKLGDLTKNEPGIMTEGRLRQIMEAAYGEVRTWGESGGTLTLVFEPSFYEFDKRIREYWREDFAGYESPIYNFNCISTSQKIERIEA